MRVHRPMVDELHVEGERCEKPGYCHLCQAEVLGAMLSEAMDHTKDPVLAWLVTFARAVVDTAELPTTTGYSTFGGLTIAKWCMAMTVMEDRRLKELGYPGLPPDWIRSWYR